MDATRPYTVLVYGPDLPEWPLIRARMRQRGVLLLHSPHGHTVGCWLSTLQPDWILAAAPLPERPAAGDPARSGSAPASPSTAWDGRAETLEALLEARFPGPPTGLLRIGPLRVDPESGTLSRVDRPSQRARLPAVELRLLLCLLRHAGRALSRDELLREAWPPGQQPQARCVDQVVRRLRVLLAPLGLDSALCSLRGLGYRFDLDPLPVTSA